MQSRSEDKVDKAEIARQVASQWVQDSTDELVVEVVGAVKDAPPVADQLDKLPSLVVGTASGSEPLALMLVLLLAADVRLIDLDRAGERRGMLLSEGGP